MSLVSKLLGYESRILVMDLITQYQKLVSKTKLERDQSQELAVERLDRVRKKILGFKSAAASRKLLSRIFKVRREVSSLRSEKNGLYMFGGVGTGKSMMMDLFYDSVDISRKRRVHFHAFMHEIHENMKNTRLERKKDPITIVCRKILSETDLLCFDEFQIIDITDAMIVGRLFQELFSGGMTVITTSNFHPDDLYKDGLNRGLFLPFISLIKENLEVLKVDNQIDYRTKKLRTQDRFFCKRDSNAKKSFDTVWEEIVGHEAEELVIHYQGRVLKLENYVNGACRISFRNLCEKPLGALDYLNLCKHIKVLFLENIPVLSKSQNDLARRFILLIDTLYEANIRLVCLSSAEPENIYSSGRFEKEFSRTVSRLNEMRGDDWQRGIK